MKKLLLLYTALVLVSACSPTIKLEAPREPIRIEANITIKHEIRIVIEKEVSEMFEDDELF